MAHINAQNYGVLESARPTRSKVELHAIDLELAQGDQAIALLVVQLLDLRLELTFLPVPERAS